MIDAVFFKRLWRRSVADCFGGEERRRGADCFGFASFRSLDNRSAMDTGLDPDILKPVSLPAAFQSVFPIRYFNAVQSERFAELFLSDDNLEISSPTGSGKTVLFELCILRLLGKSLTADGQFKHVSGSRKTVYIAPMEALVQDKLREWTERFSSLGLKCQELTSGSGSTNVLDISDTDIILSTPEKFDVITRRHRDCGGMSIFGDIALLLVDEVHLLSDTRGAALKAVVSRLKMLARFPEMKGLPLSTIRFVAVSATVSNIEDLAWRSAVCAACEQEELEMGDAVLAVKRKIAEIEQVNARIQSLVDRLPKRWRSAKSYLAAKKMLMVELELLRKRVDRYPELEQIRSVTVFRDGAGDDLRLARIANPLDQHLEVPDGGRSWWSNLCLVRSAKTCCSRLSSIAETVLQGSLCVVIAVPVMMVLARMLQDPQDDFLVPT